MAMRHFLNGGLSMLERKPTRLQTWADEVGDQ
jgi:hypothetical protein